MPISCVRDVVRHVGRCSGELRTLEKLLGTAVHKLDAGVKISYNDNIVFGASFRGYSSLSVDSVVPFIGYYFGERVSLYYSYDIGISALKTVHGGSHELFIRYDLGKAVWKGKLPPIIYNQRYKI